MGLREELQKIFDGYKDRDMTLDAFRNKDEVKSSFSKKTIKAFWKAKKRKRNKNKRNETEPPPKDENNIPLNKPEIKSFKIGNDVSRTRNLSTPSKRHVQRQRRLSTSAHVREQKKLA